MGSWGGGMADLGGVPLLVLSTDRRLACLLIERLLCVDVVSNIVVNGDGNEL